MSYVRLPRLLRIALYPNIDRNWAVHVWANCGLGSGCDLQGVFEVDSERLSLEALRNH